MVKRDISGDRIQNLQPTNLCVNFNLYKVETLPMGENMLVEDSWLHCWLNGLDSEPPSLVNILVVVTPKEVERGNPVSIGQPCNAMVAILMAMHGGLNLFYLLIIMV